MARRFQFPFGAGKLYMQPSGSLDFRRLGVAALQEGGFSIEMDIKELYGGNRFPVDVRTGKGKVTGTAKYADWDPDVIALILGVTASGTGVRKLAVEEAGTVPGSSAYTITVANSATWVKNLEVVYATDGTRLTQVASSPTQGQYSVSAGVYTFHADDASAAVKITYVFSTNSGGKVVAWTNVPIGTTPVCAGIFQGIHDADQMVLELENIVLSNMKTGSKTDDWMMIDNNMSAFANPQTGAIGRINLAMT